MRKVLAAIAISGSIVLAACNTIAGMGEDVESVGDTVEKCAEGQTC